MKNKVMACILALWSWSSNGYAAVSFTELKIAPDWRVKYNKKEWDYVYLKPLRGISSDIFEHKKQKLRLILQRETHRDSLRDYDQLVASKCQEANRLYSDHRAGKGEVTVINHKKVCYMETKSSNGKMVYQFVYPQMGEGDRYELLSYGWSGDYNKGKEIVTEFLQGFLK